MVAAVLLGALVGGVAGGVAGYVAGERTDGDPTTPAEARSVTQLSVEEDSAVIQAVQKARPAVVTVLSNLPLQRDSRGRVIESASAGSGVIIDPRGYVVTNEHVVRGAQEVTVILPSGEERPASILGHDAPYTDLAVLKIQDGGLTAVDVADSDTLTPGQRVIAIGDVLGVFRGAVSVGVVSGLDRTWRRQDGVMEGLIQTDAAVNHGSSGGALVNTAGALVGIPTTVIRETPSGEAVEGVAFAIPSNTVLEIAREIMERGRVVRPSIGVRIQEISPSDGLPIQYGALIREVAPGGPADRAGLAPGDVILTVADAPLDEDHGFYNLLKQYSPGDTVPFTVLRGGRQEVVRVTLGER
ncbi:MAG TPA: trypsin-like peptidase domain-containing protein [Dehalococcoidia bacterium]